MRGRNWYRGAWIRALAFHVVERWQSNDTRWCHGQSNDWCRYRPERRSRLHGGIERRGVREIVDEIEGEAQHLFRPESLCDSDARVGTVRQRNTHLYGFGFNWPHAKDRDASTDRFVRTDACSICGFGRPLAQLKARPSHANKRLDQRNVKRSHIRVSRADAHARIDPQIDGYRQTRPTM